MGAPAEEFNKHDASVMFMTKSHDGRNFFPPEKDGRWTESGILQIKSLPCSNIAPENKPKTFP
jgi:hypothetical protein